MEEMEYIEDYFKGQPTEEEKQQFAQRINNDISFAEKVAFYIFANGAIKEQVDQEKKQQFREIYQQRKVLQVTKSPVKKIWRYLAAASVVAAVMLTTWLITGDKNSPAQLADQYIQQNFQSLGSEMGAKDSLQSALDLFNSGKLKEAQQEFETFLKNNRSNSTAKKYAGIVSLRLLAYEKAFAYFSSLASDTTLRFNSGKFLEALTLLKRNKPGDEQAAKQLLEEVIAKDLEGKEKAVEWVKKLN